VAGTGKRALTVPDNTTLALLQPAGTGGRDDDPVASQKARRLKTGMDLLVLTRPRGIR
jgi:hypothetical protein